MRWPTFDRMDFLLTRIFIVALAAAVPAAGLGAPLVRWLGGGAFTWDLAGQERTTVAASVVPAAGTALRGTDVVAVEIDDPGLRVWAVSLLPSLALSIAAVVIAWQLLRLLGSIQAGRPFVASSAIGLRVVGVTLLATGTVVSLLSGVADSVVAGRALAEQTPSFGFVVPYWPLLGGLLLLALSEAFAQGMRLQDDVEGLV